MVKIRSWLKHHMKDRSTGICVCVSKSLWGVCVCESLCASVCACVCVFLLFVFDPELRQAQCFDGLPQAVCVCVCVLVKSWVITFTLTFSFFPPVNSFPFHSPSPSPSPSSEQCRTPLEQSTLTHSLLLAVAAFRPSQPQAPPPSW